MHYFEYHDDALCCDDMSVERVARQMGTPLYLYSHRTLSRHLRRIDQAFGERRHLVCYSLKANSNLALLAIMARAGLGADIVSGGELFRALRAGFPADRIVYSGVGKTAVEIRAALEAGILMFNVESLPELEAVDRIAGQMDKVAPIAFRINPDVDPETHPYISTGLRENKFGVDHTQVLESYQRARGLRHVEIVGIDVHIGSQITQVDPFVASAEKLMEMALMLQDNGFSLEYMDIGGGLGIRYGDEHPPDPEELVAAVAPILERSGCTILFEPGRSVIGNVGVLIVQVQYVKHTPQKTFVIVDGGMNDLIRPSLYGAYHEIRPVVRSDAPAVEVDVVGPICESGDFLAKGRALPLPKPGDLLAVMGAGAYSFSMASNYNARPRPAEVLCVDGRCEIIRQRETYEDLIRGERIL